MNRELFEAVTKRLAEVESEDINATAAPQPPAADAARLLENVERVAGAEQAEAVVLLDWFKKRPGVRELSAVVLASESGPQVVLTVAGALRSFFERALLDEDQATPVLRLERAVDHLPYVEVHASRTSPLAKSDGWTANDSLDIRLSAEEVTTHIAKRAGVEAVVAEDLWSLFHSALVAGRQFDDLFRGLEFSVERDGAIQIRLR